MSIYKSYLEFLCSKLDKLELKKYKNITVLGANIINGIFIAFCEILTGKNKVERYIYTIEKEVITKYKIETKRNGSNYIVVEKASLKKILPLKVYDIFVNRGLALDVETGNRLDNYCCWHRLVQSLYMFILALEVHHIDLNRDNNVICNFTPMDKVEHLEFHKKLNGKSIEYAIKKGNEIQKEYIEHIKSLKRNTVANNDEMVFLVLESKNNGLSVNEIKKTINNKIQKSKIYEIIRDFSSYLNEFVKMYKSQTIEPFSELDGNLVSRWGKVYDYERLLVA